MSLVELISALIASYIAGTLAGLPLGFLARILTFF